MTESYAVASAVDEGATGIAAEKVAETGRIRGPSTSCSRGRDKVHSRSPGVFDTWNSVTPTWLVVMLGWWTTPSLWKHAAPGHDGHLGEVSLGALGDEVGDVVQRHRASRAPRNDIDSAADDQDRKHHAHGPSEELRTQLRPGGPGDQLLICGGVGGGSGLGQGNPATFAREMRRAASSCQGSSTADRLREQRLQRLQRK